MLFTTYAANHKKLTNKQKNSTILIARGLDQEKFSPSVKDIRLAPSSELLKARKYGGMDFETFEEKFLIQLTETSSFKALRELYIRIKNGEDIILCCYEKDNSICHRRIIAEYLEREGGIKWQEL